MKSKLVYHQTRKRILVTRIIKEKTIVLRLAKDSLTGNDTLYVPSNVCKKIGKES